MTDARPAAAREKSSLSTRLLLSATALLIVAFGGTIVLLDTLFRRTSEDATANLLEVQALALIGAAEITPRGQLMLPPRLAEARLMSPGSGLYAEIVDAAGERVWRSPSAAGLALAGAAPLAPGERRVVRRAAAGGIEVLAMGMGVAWELPGGGSRDFRIFVAEDLAAYRAQLAQFRRQMLGWFTAVMAALLLALAWLLRLHLAPLRRMASEIEAIEGGELGELGGGYPRELAGVGRNLNRLLASERQRMARYRTTMDDLAHSLKTPLAVMRSELDGRVPDREVLDEALARMQSVINYQLRRAAATGPRSIAVQSVRLKPLVDEIAASLRQIHRDKEVNLVVEMAEGTSCRAETGDLYELVGNLLDNAWKWCAGRIRVRCDDGDSLVFAVADDGPGIPAGSEAELVGRGRRGDERAPGQGIGLAVVDEIVRLYGGALEIGRADLGGAEIRVTLPQA